MKLSKTFITVLISIIIGGVILAMQKPLTEKIIGNTVNSDVEILNSWDLPVELNEISGLTWLHDNTFACVQDEEGIIFIYDLNQNKITDKIKFADAGDYEGIAVVGDDAYVMRSDGLIFEIQDYKTSEKKVMEIKTQFSEKNNIESLTYDAENKRLLTAPKDSDLGDETYKGVYQISLNQKTMDSNPIAKIDMNAQLFKSFKNTKKINKTFNPSEIALHPETQEMYVLEGKNPKFLKLNKDGKLLSVTNLDAKKFPQPEGISFSADGRLFISNEANDGNATIIEVKIQ